MAKIGLPKGSGKRLKVREKSVKSQGILKWILSGNPACAYSEDSNQSVYPHNLSSLSFAPEKHTQRVTLKGSNQTLQMRRKI